MRRLIAPVLALFTLQTPPASLTLEIRVFNAQEEVTAETRIVVYRAGERTNPLAPAAAAATGVQFTVPQGIYDAQAVREREGRVLNIRWAERLVVMPYPDEAGHHLEVINLASGYGTLQVRAANQGPLPELAIFPASERTRAAATPVAGKGYALFVVPAGRYDLQVRTGSKVAWHPGIEVPLDRTRFWPLP